MAFSAIRAIPFALGLLALGTIGMSGGAAAQEGDPVVATVNGDEVLLSDVLAAYQSLPQQLQSLPFTELYPQLVDRVITNKLVAKAGREAGLHEKPEVQAEIRRLEDRVIEREYFSAKIDERMTDEKLQAEYDAYLEEAEDDKEVHARHILVETEDAAKELIAELDDGAEFAELAEEHSTGPSSADGGDLGFIGRGDTVAPFQAAAFALEAGTYSAAPVKTRFGWHVIKVEEVRAVEPKSFEEMKEDLRDRATEDIVTTLIEEIRADATIEVVDPPPLPGAAPSQQ